MRAVGYLLAALSAGRTRRSSEPLYYLAYARHDPAIAEDAVLGVARMLLAAGADSNAGYLWQACPARSPC